jgi:antitoxin component of MazEF toxin-antitoxin module
LHSIPFTIEAGNSQVVTLPRSAVTAASLVLEGVVPVQTRWRR